MGNWSYFTPTTGVISPLHLYTPLFPNIAMFKLDHKIQM